MMNRYLPSSMGGGSGETKMYSILGDGNTQSALFADDDDLFLDERKALSGSF